MKPDREARPNGRSGARDAQRPVIRKLVALRHARRGPQAWWQGLAIGLALSLAASGCDDAAEVRAAPTGPFAQALRELGGGGDGSLGVGWADPQLVAKAGLGKRIIRDAILPNARTVVEAATELRRRHGLDVASAERLLSVGGSYAFGLRIDGVDGRRLADALVDAGGRSRSVDRLRFVKSGAYAVVPDPLLALDVNGLGAYGAFGSSTAVLAISDRARGALLGRGDALFDETIYQAAAWCLGPEVIAARIIPGKLIISTELGVDLIAAGREDDGDEVLCTVGGAAERAADIEANLKNGLDPASPEPQTDRRIGDSLTGANVTADDYRGVAIVRAEMTLTRGEPPGYAFGTITGASVVALINGSPTIFLP